MTKKNLTGIILAGGQSSRMGSDKGLLLYQGKPLISYSIDVLAPLCSEILISSNNELYNKFGYEVVADEISGIGPMGGIYSCLKRSKNDLNLILSCDMPYVTGDIFQLLIENMGKAIISLPWHKDEHYEPLCGVYHNDVLNFISSFIKKNNFKLPDLFKEIPFAPLNVSNLDPPLSDHYFFNINKPEDLTKKV